MKWVIKLYAPNWDTKPKLYSILNGETLALSRATVFHDLNAAYDRCQVKQNQVAIAQANIPDGALAKTTYWVEEVP